MNILPGKTAGAITFSAGRVGVVCNPFHPLLSVVFAVGLLTTGLFLLQPELFFTFLLSATALFVLAGYGRMLARLYLPAMAAGIVLAGIATLLGESRSGAVMIVGRIALISLSMSAMFSVDPTQLSRALCQVNCPRVLALGALITVRFVPVLKSEFDRIREAMRVRGVLFSWYKFSHLYRAIILPLLIRLISIADTLTLSMETRGFSMDSKGTVYKPVPWRGKDYLFSGLFVILLAAAWMRGVMLR